MKEFEHFKSPFALFIFLKLTLKQYVEIFLDSPLTFTLEKLLTLMNVKRFQAFVQMVCALTRLAVSAVNALQDSVTMTCSWSVKILMSAAMAITFAREMQTASTVLGVTAANVLRVSNFHPTEPVWIAMNV